MAGRTISNESRKNLERTLLRGQCLVAPQDGSFRKMSILNLNPQSLPSRHARHVPLREPPRQLPHALVVVHQERRLLQLHVVLAAWRRLLDGLVVLFARLLPRGAEEHHDVVDPIFQHPQSRLLKLALDAYVARGGGVQEVDVFVRLLWTHEVGLAVGAHLQRRRTGVAVSADGGGWLRERHLDLDIVFFLMFFRNWIF